MFIEVLCICDDNLTGKSEIELPIAFDTQSIESFKKNPDGEVSIYMKSGDCIMTRSITYEQLFAVLPKITITRIGRN